MPIFMVIFPYLILKKILFLGQKYTRYKKGDILGKLRLFRRNGWKAIEPQFRHLMEKAEPCTSGTYSATKKPEHFWQEAKDGFL